MKKIYTSNYARNGNNDLAYAISAIIPDWYTGKSLPFLAPKIDMVGRIKKNVNNYAQRKYEREYLDLLKSRNVDPHKLIDMLPDGAILLCYEKPGDFCHRRILAKWIEIKTGFKIEEWKTEKELENYKQNKIVDSMLEF